MKTSVALLAVFVMAGPLLAAADTHARVPPADALELLVRGNQRYAADKPAHPHQDKSIRHAIATGQHPFAAILSCADSRVPPELVFDEGLGDLFVVRVAGNVVDDAVTGSLEYAVEHLGVSLIVVLGHTHCGAVEATLRGGEPNTHIDALVRAILPAAEQARKRPGDPAENTMRENVALAVSQLRNSGPVLRNLVDHGRLRVIGAVYDLETGRVQYLEPLSSRGDTPPRRW